MSRILPMKSDQFQAALKFRLSELLDQTERSIIDGKEKLIGTLSGSYSADEVEEISYQASEAMGRCDQRIDELIFWKVIAFGFGQRDSEAVAKIDNLISRIDDSGERVQHAADRYAGWDLGNAFGGSEAEAGSQQQATN